MTPRGKSCDFCANDVSKIDYKKLNILKKYISDRGKILPRRISGNCAKHQRQLTKSIKQARSVALLPYKID